MAQGVTVDFAANLARYSNNVEKAAQQLDKFEKTAGKVSRNVKTAFGALGLGLIFREITQKTTEQEKSIAQLESRIKSTGGVAGYTSQQLQDMAQGLQDVTNYGDEATMQMQSLLLTFTNIRGDVFKETQEAVLNVATTLETDLKSAALQVGKALNDPVLGITALSRAGIQFSEDQKKTIKSMVDTGRTVEAQKVILKELETQFGGAARAARDTFGGSIVGLKNAFGDLLEGRSGLNEAKESVNEFTKLLQEEKTKQGFDTLVSGIVVGSTKILEYTAKAAQAVKDLSETVAEFFYGPDTAEGIMQKRIEAVQGEIDKLEFRLSDPTLGGVVTTWLFGSEGELKQQLEEKKRELEILKQSLDSFAGSGAGETGGAATTGGAAAAAALEEERRVFKDREEMLRSAAKVYDDTRTPMENYAVTLERLDVLLAEGTIDFDTYSRAVFDAGEKFTELSDKGDDSMNRLIDAVQGWGRAFTDTFTEMVMTGKASFADLADSIIRDLIRIQIQKNITGPLLQAGSEYLSSMFASGGVMTSNGPVPLNTYAFGGIANTPQLAVFGEGSTPEAFVPLPDGRSIPVTLSGSGGGGGGIGSLKVIVENQGSPVEAEGAGVTFDAEGMVVRVLLKDQKNNGPVTAGMARKFGLSQRV